VTPFTFWPCAAGVVFLIAGLFTVRHELSAGLRLQTVIPLGRVFVATALAVFAAEHLAGPRFLMELVPPWIPGRLFWAYLVGVALLAAAVSFILQRHLRLSATLLAIMFLSFVLLIHLPNVVANPTDRILWAVCLRDLSFAGGALAYAMTRDRHLRSSGHAALLFLGRMCVAVPLIFFGVENILHPDFAPGVPLPKMTPAWVPLPYLWAYLIGAILLFGGVATLLNRRSRAAAAAVGIWSTLLAFLLYFPILLMAHGTSQIIEGVNYVADTLLFAGIVFLLADAMPEDTRESLPPAIPLRRQ
jgi:uncharacterized membrane protein